MLNNFIFRQKHENKSDEWVELNIVKEFLIEEQTLLHKEKDSIESLNIPNHYKNILNKEMDKRLDMINYLLQKTRVKIQDC